MSSWREMHDKCAKGELERSTQQETHKPSEPWMAWHCRSPWRARQARHGLEQQAISSLQALLPCLSAALTGRRSGQLVDVCIGFLTVSERSGVACALLALPSLSLHAAAPAARVWWARTVLALPCCCAATSVATIWSVSLNGKSLRKIGKLWWQGLQWLLSSAPCFQNTLLSCHALLARCADASSVKQPSSSSHRHSRFADIRRHHLQSVQQQDGPHSNQATGLGNIFYRQGSGRGG